METVIEDYRANRRPTVVNMSIGEHIGTTEYTSLDYAVQQAIAEGIVVVVSAGNFGQDASHSTPAHVEQAITVGSFGMSGWFSPFSNYGPQVDILAPGEDVISFNEKGKIHAMSGTSMAAAHVTGAAALYLSENPAATPAEVQAALLSSAKAVITGVPSNTTNRMVWVGQSDEVIDFDTDMGDDITKPREAKDDFKSKDFSGGKGDWATDWLEAGESDGNARGLLQARKFGKKNCESGKECMGLGAAFKRANGVNITRAIDLSGPFDPVVEFDYNVRRFLGHGHVQVNVSNDAGVTWETLKTYSFGDGGQSGTETFTLPGYNTAGFRIRFELMPNASGTISGGFFVDNIEINY
jgi:hypothetical protein